MSGFCILHTVDELLFGTAEFRKFGQENLASQSNQKIRTVTYCGIGRDAAEAIATTTFDAKGKFADWLWCSSQFIGIDHANKCFSNGMLHKSSFTSYLLLRKYKQRFVKLGVAME
ncbi:hypothetical protein D3C80_701720 [compost metagenome]